MTDEKERMHWSTRVLAACIGAYALGTVLVAGVMFGLLSQIVGSVGACAALMGLAVGIGVAVFVEPYPSQMDAAAPWYKPVSRQILLTILVSLYAIVAHDVLGLPILFAMAIVIGISAITITVITFRFRRELRRLQEKTSSS